MLIDTLNECIIDMKTIYELETVSADSKKQAIADYNFKQLVMSLKQTISEVNLAVDNSDFKPSIQVVSALKSLLGACDKIIQTGAANNATTTYINSESKKLYAAIGKEWGEYYTKSTSSILSLLDTVKGILSNEEKAKFADILSFLKLVSDGNATIKNLTDEILAWIRAENLEDKMFIKF